MFRSIAYVHVPAEKRKKLDDHSVKTIFIGYEQGFSKGYKLYNITTKNVIVSRDVIFDKEDTWNW